jgi:hypothetical protein
MNDESRPKAAPETAGWQSEGSVTATPRQTRDLDVARAMATAGIPIFVAHPNNSLIGFRLPDKWQTTTPNPRYIDAWRPVWRYAP